MKIKRSGEQMADGDGGHARRRSLFAYYGTLPSLPSSGSRCDEWSLVPWLVSPTLGGGHPFENNFTCAIEDRGALARRRTWSGVENHIGLLCSRAAAECHPGGLPPMQPRTTRLERGENGSRRPPPVAPSVRARQANVAVVSARFQSGQRHCTVVSRMKGKV